MVDTVTIALVAMAAIVATIFGIKKDAKKGTKSKPPPNKAAEVAREVAQKEFDDNIKSSHEGSTRRLSCGRPGASAMRESDDSPFAHVGSVCQRISQLGL